MRSLKNLLFTVTLICHLQASAQSAPEEVKRTFYGGVSAGANFSALIGDVYSGYHKLGFNAGGVVYARVSPLLGASAEILYSQKGCRGIREIYSQYNGDMLEKYSVDLNYVEAPVQLIIMYDAKLNYGLGISYSRLLNSREDLQSDQPYNIDPSLYVFQREDWAFLGSVNLNFYKNWLVTFRYQQSFKPIREPYYVPLNLGTGKQYNTYFTLKLIRLF